MPPDPAVVPWVMEFVLRQPLEDSLLNSLLLSLPSLSPPISHRLRRTLLLHRLASDLSRRCLLPRSLSSFELLLSLGLDPSPAMSKAYVAVAADLSAAALRRGGDTQFAAAVQRIWARRVADLLHSDTTPAGLDSDQFVRAQKEMLEAVQNPETRARILERDTEKEAFDALMAFLKEESRILGPTFLERVAKIVVAEGIELEEEHPEPPETEAEKEKEKKMEARGVKFISSSNVLAETTVRCELDRFEMDGTMEPSALHQIDRHKKSVLIRVQGTSGQPGCSSDKYDPLPTPVVERVANALKSSCADLLMAVEDPLPAAVAVAAEVLMDLRGQKEVQPQLDEKGPVSDVEMGAEGNCAAGASVGTGQGGECDAVGMNPNRSGVEEPEGSKNMEEENTVVTDAEGTRTAAQWNKEQNGGARCSLFERNPTAHTIEWGEDSLDSISEKSSSPSKKLGLRSPKRRAMSPLKPVENKRIVKRRKVRRWSLLEEDTLRKAVEKFGKGSWKMILQNYPDIFEERTEVDLKDKWRNMTRH